MKWHFIVANYNAIERAGASHIAPLLSLLFQDSLEHEFTGNKFIHTDFLGEDLQVLLRKDLEPADSRAGSSNNTGKELSKMFIHLFHSPALEPICVVFPNTIQMRLAIGDREEQVKFGGSVGCE